jgi:hypothetical protein
MKLSEISDDAPMLAALIGQRLDKGARVYLGKGDVRITNVQWFRWRPWQFTLICVDPESDSAERTHIQRDEEDQYELTPDGKDWRVLRRAAVSEGIDEDQLLLGICKQILARGEEIYMSINVHGKGKSGMKYNHQGTMQSLRSMEATVAVQRALGFTKAVIIKYIKQGPDVTATYKGFTEVIIPVEDFDSLYSLKPFKHQGTTSWELLDNEAV